MNKPLLIFILLSGAAHAFAFSGYQDSANQRQPGNIVQVSLLSGPQQQSASLNGKPSGEAGDPLQRNLALADDHKPRAATAPFSTHESKSNTHQTIGLPGKLKSASTPPAGEIIALEIQKLLAAKFVYPIIAQKYGHQGKVIVQVRIEASGVIDGTQLIKSSGFRTLDLAAQRSIRDLAEAPHLQQWLHGKSVRINVPITYRLVET